MDTSNSSETEVCVPGQEICKKDGTTVLGKGTYERNGSVYATLVGFIHQSTTDDGQTRIEVQPHRKLALIPEEGQTVYCKVTLVNPRFCKCSIVGMNEQTFESPFRGMIRKEDVRATEKDKVDMYHSYKPGDIIIARVADPAIHLTDVCKAVTFFPDLFPWRAKAQVVAYPNTGMTHVCAATLNRVIFREIHTRLHQLDPVRVLLVTDWLNGRESTGLGASIAGEVVEGGLNKGRALLNLKMSLGDAQSYLLSTAENELGVVLAWSESSKDAMVPLSWSEMYCPQSGHKEFRKVAKMKPEYADYLIR